MGEHAAEAQVKDDPARPYKAYIAAGWAAVFAFVSFWVADSDPFTAKEIGQALLLAGGAAGLGGGATYVASNPKVPTR